MLYGFALVLLFFVHGSPPTVNGDVVAVFDKQEDCLQVMQDIVAKERARSTLVLCVEFTDEGARVL